MTERAQTALILLALTLLAAGVGLAAAGAAGVWFAVISVAFLWLVAPQVPNAWVLRSVKSRRLHRWEAPELFETRDRLASRAGLSRAPGLYVIASPRPQAFTIGEPHDAAIVFSRGLARTLTLRELTGVLAHEMAHVAHGDVRLLRFATTLTHVTAGLSQAAVVLLLIGLPLIIAGALPFDPLVLLVAVVAPWIAQFLLLALSRTREFAADAGAARLTRDPGALASALSRLEAQGQNFWHRLLGLRPAEMPDWTRTHPSTRERIRRLMADATSRTRRSEPRELRRFGHPRRRMNESAHPQPSIWIQRDDRHRAAFGGGRRGRRVVVPVW